MSAPSITLYSTPGSCAIVAHILLNHTGLNYNLEAVPRNTLTTTFSAINPKQQVPVFVVDEETVTENAAIAQFINQLAPEARIFGETPMQFVRTCEWLNYSSAAIHAQAWGPYLRPWRFTTNKSAEPGVQAACEQKVRDRYDLIESKLPSDGWILGTKSLTAADVYLYPFYQWWTERMEDDFAERHPKWAKIVKRLESLEAVKKTLKEVEQMKIKLGSDAGFIGQQQ